MRPRGNGCDDTGMLSSAQQADHLQSRRQVEARTDPSWSSLDRLMAAGSFLQPPRVGERSIGWRVSGLDAWPRSRPRAEALQRQRSGFGAN